MRKTQKTATRRGFPFRRRPGAQPPRRGRARGRTETLDDALLAARSSRIADAAAVPDEEMGEARPVRAWHDALQVALDLHGVLVSRQAKSLRKPAHVGIDDDPLRVAELGGDDVGGLARDAGQLHEIGERPRNLAVELLDEHPHGASDRLRLLAEEPGRIDVSLELLDGHREVVLGLPVLGEERGRHPVHVHVRRLRREHHRDEELEIAPEAQRDLRVRVLLGQSLDDRDDAVATTPEAAPSLADVATRHGATRSTRWSPSGPVDRAEDPISSSSMSGRSGAPHRSDRRLDVVLGVAELDSSGPSNAQNAPRSPSYGIPTLPGLTIRRPGRERAVVLHVGVAADEHSASTGPRTPTQLVVRRDARVDGLVGRGGRVADEHPSETLDVELERQRPGVRRREPRRLRADRRTKSQAGRTVVRSTHHFDLRRCRGRRARRVPSTTSKTSTGHGPMIVSPTTTIASTSLALDLREHGLERRQVPVDVADRRDAHGATLPRE